MRPRNVATLLNDARLNFLIGSGASRPHFNTLGNIEKVLTAIDRAEASDETKRSLTTLCKKRYVDDVVAPELNLAKLEKLTKGTTEHETISAYTEFLKTIYQLISKRETPVTSKQVNVFTTNYDTCLEHSLESIGIRYNDGFEGKLEPSFKLSNYGFISKRQSLLYEFVTDVPSFNLFKLHGSFSWKSDPAGIITLDQNRNVACKLVELSANICCDTPIDANDFEEINLKLQVDPPIEVSNDDKFLEIYKDLLIVNPTKNKFEETLLDRNYYEMLRMFSNELEKENAVLYVIGFSFADEHIREIVARSLCQNPTLTVIIFCHSVLDHENILQYSEFSNLPFGNLVVVKPNDLEVESLTISEITRHYFSSTSEPHEGGIR